MSEIIHGKIKWSRNNSRATIFGRLFNFLLIRIIPVLFIKFVKQLGLKRTRNVTSDLFWQRWVLYSRAKSTGAAKKTPELLSLLSIRGDKFPEQALAECASSAFFSCSSRRSICRLLKTLFTVIWQKWRGDNGFGAIKTDLLMIKQERRTLWTWKK